MCVSVEEEVGGRRPLLLEETIWIQKQEGADSKNYTL
jgi:hypothetical protein